MTSLLKSLALNSLRGTTRAESNLFRHQTGSKTCLHSTSTRRHEETDAKNESNSLLPFHVVIKAAIFISKFLESLFSEKKFQLKSNDMT
ncbi:hypothetical protein BpHYR1_050430 [Brachionus plicatilis]|uniref:Uncharacterized protein n=1 Tax=Brachionus plicatilis TaxID=10195 RepID=A0A3M7T0K2_BRAPC|nr:hypothetical protein BpHYR1_050430 [Brachionus plicatilis]